MRKYIRKKENFVSKYLNIVQLVNFNLPCVVESSFFCHDRTVETLSGYYSDSKKQESTLKQTVEAGFGLKNQT